MAADADSTMNLRNKPHQHDDSIAFESLDDDKDHKHLRRKIIDWCGSAAAADADSTMNLRNNPLESRDYVQQQDSEACMCL